MNNRLLLLLSMILIISCEKEPAKEHFVAGDEAPVSLSVEVFDYPSTKGSSTYEYPFEKKVNSVAYYVFNSGGKLEASFTNTSTSAVQRKLTTGAKTIYALINMPSSRFSSCKTVSELESKCAFMSDLDNGGMPMSGKKSVTISAGSNTVTISVERLLSRITIGNIYNRLANSLEGEEIRLGNIYLTNIVGSSTIAGGTPSTYQWYNFAGRRDNATGAGDFINAETDCAFRSWSFYKDSRTVSWNSYESPSNPLYFFPNNTTTTDRNGWSTSKTARFTRLVVEAYVRGERYFYPINLNGAKRNTAYDLNLTITRPGSLDPDTFDWAEIQDMEITIGGFDEWDDDFVITY